MICNTNLYFSFNFISNYSETLIGNTPESSVSLITSIQSVSTEYLFEPSNFENNESYSAFTFNNLSENIPNDRFDELKFLTDTDCFSPSASLPTYCPTDNPSRKFNNNQNQKSVRKLFYYHITNMITYDNLFRILIHQLKKIILRNTH